MIIERENGITERKEYEDEKEFLNDLRLIKRDPAVKKITTSSGLIWERRQDCFRGGMRKKVKLRIPRKRDFIGKEDRDDRS